VTHLRQLWSRVDLVRDDLRRLATDPDFAACLLDQQDCVIHLAAISNDPSAELNPELTREVNFRATHLLALAARERRIKFVFSSSCSVYGEASEEVDEDGALCPLSVYAVSKVEAERTLADLADSHWAPIILRNGTLFGFSSRMRFDLVANIFALHCALRNEINIFGEGQQWRPFLHVSDCARAFIHFAEQVQPRYQCYNIARQNLRVVDLAELYTRINPRLRIQHVDVAEPDNRDYSVSTARMVAAGFQTRIAPETGIEEMVDTIIGGLIPDPESIYHRNAKWLGELSQIGNLDAREVLQLVETLVEVREAARS
jgi:nucleoside-diphosphate-sugar epimerase